jgi:hypothetical protein
MLRQGKPTRRRAARPLRRLPANHHQEHLGDLRQKQNRHADAIAAWQKPAGDGDSIDRAKIQKIDTARKSR